MAVPVHFAARDNQGRITHLGGVGPGSTSWQLSAAEVIGAIDSGDWLFLTQGPQTRLALVTVRRSGSSAYLMSVPDGTTVNNLDNLPTIVSPIGGAWPSSPMNFPSVVRRDRLGFNRARVSVTGRQGPQTRVPHQSSTIAPWGLMPVVNMSGVDRSATRLSLDVRMPFPATYYVTVLGDSGQVAPLRRENSTPASGTHGWFTWAPGPTFFDNGGPHRLAEMRLVCALPPWAWQSQDFTIEVGSLSINPYARELLGTTPLASQFIRFANLGPAQGSAAAAAPPVTVPNCVGQTLAEAMDHVEAEGLRSQAFAADLLYGLPHVDWRVVSQSPTPGSSLARGRVVQLFAAPDTQPTSQGVQTIRVFNQYQQRRSLHVWNRDITAGTWTDEGEATYGGSPVSVSLTDGHLHALFYADYQLNSCTPQADYPPDLCVYRGPDGPFVGDDDGVQVDIAVS